MKRIFGERERKKRETRDLKSEMPQIWTAVELGVAGNCGRIKKRTIGNRETKLKFKTFESRSIDTEAKQGEELRGFRSSTDS